jgi:hypothetical protein
MKPLASLLVIVVLATGPALAHSGHQQHAGTGTDPLLPLALVGGGVLVLGTSVYLDRVDELSDRLASLGVLLGIAGLMAGIALGLV